MLPLQQPYLCMKQRDKKEKADTIIVPAFFRGVESFDSVDQVDALNYSFPNWSIALSAIISSKCSI